MNWPSHEFPPWRWFHIFPRLAPVIHFPALGVALGKSRFGVTDATGKLCFQVQKSNLKNHNYLPENNVILVRDVVIPYLFVYKMTVDSFPSRVGQRLGGANHT